MPLSRTIEPSATSGARRLEALELAVPSGVWIRVTASGDVTETRGNRSRQIALGRSRRAALQRLFTEAPVELGGAGGWLSYVPSGLLEVVIRTRYGGEWSAAPTYRRCGSSTDNCRLVTESINTFVDTAAKLAGYSGRFQCAPNNAF